MRRLTFLLFTTLLLITLQCQVLGASESESDSLTYTKWSQKRFTWVDRAPVETTVGVLLPVIVYDLAHFRQDYSVRSIREQYAGKYNNRIDDFIVPIPLLTTWGMRFAGVEGRSISHLEALTAQGLTMGLTLGITGAGKYITKRMRPDGSTSKSFPSGHTALAFASAAILDAEYGAEYPWLSALGYGMATSVGVARIANNRHWATDVITGAGVGIISTYVGYLLNDLLWGRGVERFRLDYSRNEWESPYYISIQKNFTTLLSSTADYKASGIGNSIGLMARIPVYKQLGVRASGALLTSDNKLVPKEYLHGYSLMVGADYMEGFWSGRLWLDGNLSVGYLSEIRLSEGLQSRSNSIPFIAPSALIRLGVGATLLTTEHFAVQLNGGYNLAPLARPYSRKIKKGLNGVDFGIGMTYVIH